MNKPDDLEHLWKSQPVGTAMEGEQMRDIVLKRITGFDRMIRLRNRMESGAALIVAIFFAYAGWKQHSEIERLGSAIIVAGALWIIFYIRRHGAYAADPAPDQTVASYRQALVLNYEHQIRLLRNVKFWYLLPLYVGLFVLGSGALAEQARTRPLTWTDAVPPLAYTLVFAGVWWLNEVYSVRKLQRLRTQVASGGDEELTT